jgi:Fe2+ transport system protein B
VEVIKEVPVEVKVIEYVDREVVIEVPVEKVVEKIVNIYDNSQTDELLLKIQQLEERKPEVIEKVVGDETKQRMLEQTLQTLRADNFNKDKRIKELEEIVSDFKKYEQKMGAVFLRGTNLDDTLFK